MIMMIHAGKNPHCFEKPNWIPLAKSVWVNEVREVMRPISLKGYRPREL